MNGSEMMYILLAAALVLVVVFGLWRVSGRARDPHSGLTEVEEARRKTLH